MSIGKTGKELDKLKEMSSKREIDHRTLIAAKDQDFNECKRQLAETREQLVSQTQELATEREKREAVSEALSIVREKFERTIDELEMERQTRLDFQEQNKQLMAEKDALMKKLSSSTVFFNYRFQQQFILSSELKKTERSRTEKSDN